MIRLASPQRPLFVHPERVLAGGVVLLAGLLVIANVIGMAFGLAALVGLGVIVVVAWRWPAATAVFFVLFTPVNRFAIAGLFLAFHSPQLDKFALLWKDALIGILVARVLYDALFSRRAITLRYLDFLVFAFIALSTVYVFYPGSLDTDLFTRLQGFRSDASFLFAYFIGRALVFERRHIRWMVLGLTPGSILIFGVAMFEFFAPALAAHYVDALGITDFETVRNRSISGVELHRASALVGDLALSFYQMVLVALASALYVESSGRRRLWSGLFLGTMVAALVATLTRSAILTGIAVILITAVLARRPIRVAVLGGVAAIAGIAGIVLSGIRLETVQRLFSLQDASTQGHLHALQRSLAQIQHEPLGRGLGTAGTIGQRFVGDRAITNENWYLQLGTEMGILAAVLYLAIVAIVAVACFHTYFGVRDTWLRTLALGIGAAAVGFLILGNLLHAWENTILSMAFWLMAGIVVRARDLDVSPSFAAKRIPAREQQA